VYSSANELSLYSTYRDVPGNEEGERRSNVARISGAGFAGGNGVTGLVGSMGGIGSLDDASAQPTAIKAAKATMSLRDIRRPYPRISVG
jgi:hypothetical protein